ncbi:hypothetical protein HYE35_00825 [Mycoplasmopsis bovis]|nr:hypothetical protein [Mycoplasmopsis bovis]QQH21592.1 hypothetical protein HYE35_00825 [Mycoplasmopsis bovis]
MRSIDINNFLIVTLTIDNELKITNFLSLESIKEIFHCDVIHHQKR